VEDNINAHLSEAAKVCVCEGEGKKWFEPMRFSKGSEHMGYHDLVVIVIKPSFLNVSLQHSGGSCQAGNSNFL
jgi:hypothetical protein